MRLLGGLAFAALVVGAYGGAAPSAEPTTPTKKCSRGFVHAVIAGKHQCLRAGQRCKRRLDRTYHRYKFHCHTGRLTRPRPAPPAQPIGTVTARIPLAGVASAVAVGEDAVWVREGTTVQRINPATNAVTASVAVGEGLPLAAGEGAVWAPNTDSETVSRIDPRTNAVTATIRLQGTDPMGVATGAGAVWVGVQNPEGVLAAIERIDPATNSVVTSITEPGTDIGPGIAVSAGAVWTGGRPAGARIDATTNRVVARIGSPRAGDVAADADAVWAASGLDVQGLGLVRIDPGSNSVVTTISVLDSPTAGVAVGFSAVWVTTTRRPTTQSPYVLARIDPRTNSVAGTMRLTLTGDVATGFESVWVAAGNTLLRLQPAA
jgi:YVTN family beta-propeller protein